MNKKIRYFLLAVMAAFMVGTVTAQSQTWREIHKVKKKETIFGIARQYGLTIQELVDANPEMNKPGYELKKDSYIMIPYAKGNKVETQTPQPQLQPVASEVKQPTAKKKFQCHPHGYYAAPTRHQWRRSPHGGVLSWSADGL